MNGTFRAIYRPEIELDFRMRGFPSRHRKKRHDWLWGRGLPTTLIGTFPVFNCKSKGPTVSFEHLTMAIEVQDFPNTDAYVDVAILDGGGMIGSSSIMHAEGPPTEINMSCWVFYINHPPTGKKVIWDVGISAVS